MLTKLIPVSSYALSVLLSLVCTQQARAVNLVSNGDFETGDFSSWSTFTTPNGVISELPQPNVVAFDVNNDGTATNSAQFNVGQLRFRAAPRGQARGGGIFQSFNYTGNGTLRVRADIGISTPEENGSGGIFQLLFDGEAIDRFDFGEAEFEVPEFASLSANLSNVSVGNHELRIQITRPFTNSAETPRQYVDNVEVLSVPFNI